MSAALAAENIWFNKAQCDDAERAYYEKLAGAKGTTPAGTAKTPGLSDQIAKARQHIKNSLECVDSLVTLAGGDDQNLVKKLNDLEIENKQLKKVTDDLKSLVLKLESRVATLEGKGGKPAPAPAAAAPAAAPAAAADDEDDDDDEVDLFGSDDDDEETAAEKERITAERLKAYAEKKSKKPALIAKTSVLFDVKPWDDETDMKKMLEACKSIEKEGLVWGASKLVPVGYGINKLQLMCVVEDEKVSIEELGEQMEAFEDYIQSVDVASMSKI
jgi:elongation factor 1-delta